MVTKMLEPIGRASSWLTEHGRCARWPPKAPQCPSPFKARLMRTQPGFSLSALIQRAVAGADVLPLMYMVVMNS